jgi:thiamine transport system ATP-binding protein
LLTAAGLPSAPAVAVRRSALSVVDDGPIEGTIEGTVVEVRTTPGQLRLVCRTDLGDLDAVASLDHRLATGDRVRLHVDGTRTASLASPAPAPAGRRERTLD